MEKKTLLLIAGAGALAFLYMRSRGAATLPAPAAVNAGTAAPVGNTATAAVGTTQAQTEAGSEAAYVTKPLALGAVRASASWLDDAQATLAARLKDIQGFMSNNPAQT